MTESERIRSWIKNLDATAKTDTIGKRGPLVVYIAYETYESLLRDMNRWAAEFKAIETEGAV